MNVETLAPLVGLLHLVIMVTRSSNESVKIQVTFRDMNDAGVTFGTLAQLTAHALVRYTTPSYVSVIAI